MIGTCADYCATFLDVAAIAIVTGLAGYLIGVVTGERRERRT